MKKEEAISKFELEIFNQENWVEFSKRTEFAPNKAGVYCFFLDEVLLYVGESGCIKARMGDAGRTLNHSFRRDVGNKKFCHLDSFEKADSKNKFPECIELLVDEYFSALFVSFVSIDFGRLETEEHLVKKFTPEFNKKLKRE